MPKKFYVMRSNPRVMTFGVLVTKGYDTQAEAERRLAFLRKNFSLMEGARRDIVQLSRRNGSIIENPDRLLGKV